MKKTILVALVVILTAGLGFGIYYIFAGRNIKFVQLQGAMQTVYFVGDAAPDFEDLTLKITYKSGAVSTIKAKDASVEVNSFSTKEVSKEKQTMKLVYKSEVFDISYLVINKGLYYMSYNEGKYRVPYTPSGNWSTNIPDCYDSASTIEMIDFKDNGVIQFYSKSNLQWNMHDGYYNSDYNYELVGNSIKVNMPNQSPWQIIPEIYNGNIQFKVSIKTYASDSTTIMTEQNKTYKHTTDMKTGSFRQITTHSVDYYLAAAKVDEDNGNVVTFNQGYNIKTSKIKLRLKVTYTDTFMQTVYVYITDDMVVDNSLDTSEKTSASFAEFNYNGKTFVINYKVV